MSTESKGVKMKPETLAAKVEAVSDVTSLNGDYNRHASKGATAPIFSLRSSAFQNPTGSSDLGCRKRISRILFEIYQTISSSHRCSTLLSDSCYSIRSHTNGSLGYESLALE